MSERHSVILRYQTLLVQVDQIDTFLKYTSLYLRKLQPRGTSNRTRTKKLLI